jgi:hypothetical protein
MARTFTIHTGRGRYVADTPIDAAKKAAAKLFKNNKAKSLRFCIRETTKDSKKKLYYYKAYKADKNAKNSIIVSVDKSKKTFSGGSPTHGNNAKKEEDMRHWKANSNIISKMNAAFKEGFDANLQKDIFRITEIEYFKNFDNLVNDVQNEEHILKDFIYKILNYGGNIIYMAVTNRETRQIRYFYFKEGKFLCSLFPLIKEEIYDFLSKGTLPNDEANMQNYRDKILQEQKRQEQQKKQEQEKQEQKKQEQERQANKSLLSKIVHRCKGFLCIENTVPD